MGCLVVILGGTTLVFFIAFLAERKAKNDEKERSERSDNRFSNLQGKSNQIKAKGSKLNGYIKNYYGKDVIIFDTSKGVYRVIVKEIKLKFDPYEVDDYDECEILFKVKDKNGKEFDVVESHINNIMTKQEADEMDLC